MTWWRTRLIFGLHVALLTTGAYFIADAVNLLIARQLEASIRPEDRQPVLAVSRAMAGVDRTAYRRILEGDLFHPDQRGQVATEPDATAAAPLAPLDLPVTLIGTVAGEGPFSFAVIEDRATREQQVFRLDDVVKDGAVLAKVERNQVVLRLGTREQILTLYSDGTQDVAPDGAAPGGTVPPTIGGASGQAGVRQVQPNHWLLDKQEVTAALSNLSQLLTKARVIPNFTDGKPDGFKIFSIAPDSLYAKIGLQNGDVLQQINGVEVKDPENFMRVFQQLKDQNMIALDFVRNNRRESYTYEIR